MDLLSIAAKALEKRGVQAIAGIIGEIKGFELQKIWMFLRAVGDQLKAFSLINKVVSSALDQVVLNISS